MTADRSRMVTDRGGRKLSSIPGITSRSVTVMEYQVMRPASRFRYGARVGHGAGSAGSRPPRRYELLTFGPPTGSVPQGGPVG